jgi:peroxiredoxin
VSGLPVGSTAPHFTLRDQHGRSVTLGSFAGSRHVLLVFFPHAFSSVCSNELATLRDTWPARSDVIVLAVSCDPMFALRAFDEAERLGLPLLSDFWPHGAVSAAYGVLDEERGCSQRSTFLVDPEGTISWSVHNALPDERSVEDYLAALERDGS